jgi:thiamine biosynthesis lipoprotein
MPHAVWDFNAIGTTWQVETDAPLPAHVREEITRLVEDFDRSWSRFRSDSLVSELARAPGPRTAPPDTTVMLDAYVALATATSGAVNPLVGDALAHRGYDAAYSLVDRGARRSPGRWGEVLRWSDDEICLAEPATIDVGALGKGRLVDRVLDAVGAHTEGPIVVDAGGDLAVRSGPGGPAAERVALEHPFDSRRAIGVWRIADAALCASAVNRRSWGDGLHHVLDARTGEPVRTIAATWAVASDAMTADATATALFFDGGPAYAAGAGAQWVRMTTAGRVEWSPGCTAELFS